VWVLSDRKRILPRARLGLFWYWICFPEGHLELVLLFFQVCLPLRSDLIKCDLLTHLQLFNLNLSSLNKRLETVCDCLLWIVCLKTSHLFAQSLDLFDHLIQLVISFIFCLFLLIWLWSLYWRIFPGKEEKRARINSWSLYEQLAFQFWHRASFAGAEHFEKGYLHAGATLFHKKTHPAYELNITNKSNALAVHELVFVWCHLSIGFVDDRNEEVQHCYDHYDSHEYEEPPNPAVVIAHVCSTY